MAFREGFEFRRGPERYSGREHEADLFGAVDVKDPGYAAELAKTADSRGYLNFARATELAKKYQPGDPANPRKDFFRELLIAVQEQLGVDPERHKDALKAYTAVGTPLDRFHGTDAFITYDDRGREIMVTLDATLRQEKLQQGWKADVMVGEVPDIDDADEAYLRTIDSIASQIAKSIRSRGQERREAA